MLCRAVLCQCLRIPVSSSEHPTSLVEAALFLVLGIPRATEGSLFTYTQPDHVGSLCWIALPKWISALDTTRGSLNVVTNILERCHVVCELEAFGKIIEVLNRVNPVAFYACMQGNRCFPHMKGVN